LPDAVWTGERIAATPGLAELTEYFYNIGKRHGVAMACHYTLNGCFGMKAGHVYADHESDPGTGKIIAFFKKDPLASSKDWNIA